MGSTQTKVSKIKENIYIKCFKTLLNDNTLCWNWQNVRPTFGPNYLWNYWNMMETNDYFLLMEWVSEIKLRHTIVYVLTTPSHLQGINPWLVSTLPTWIQTTVTWRLSAYSQTPRHILKYWSILSNTGAFSQTPEHTLKHWARFWYNMYTLNNALFHKTFTLNVLLWKFGINVQFRKSHLIILIYKMVQNKYTMAMP